MNYLVQTPIARVIFRRNRYLRLDRMTLVKSHQESSRYERPPELPIICLLIESEVSIKEVKDVTHHPYALVFIE